ncbi:MAG: hypothetical protein K8T20_04715 [Planctomycetes bacterium]|nr:hypothetical protein [Planctomycetota bacterium]
MPSKGDVEFGSLAIREKLSTKERVEECSKYQEEIEKDGRQTTLDRVMLQKGYLTEAQVFELNKKQGRRVVFCVKCAMKMNVAGLAVGQKIKCPKCGMSNVTPEKIAFEVVEKSKPVGEPYAAGAAPVSLPVPDGPILPVPGPGGMSPRPPTVKMDLRPGGGSQSTVRMELKDENKPEAETPDGAGKETGAPAVAGEEKTGERLSDAPKIAEIRADGKGKKFAGRRYGKR